MRIVGTIMAVMLAGAAMVGCGRAEGSGGIASASAASAPVAVGTARRPPGDEEIPVQLPPATLARVRNSELPASQGALARADRPTAAPASPAAEAMGDAAVADRSPPLVNSILAEVNGELITREDILGPLRPQMRQWRKEYAREAFESRCRQAEDLKLREAISRRLVVQEAKAKLSDQEKTAVEAALDQTFKNMASEAGSVHLLEEKLKSRGMSLETEKQKERERLLIQRFLRTVISPTVQVTHSELLDYYQRVRSERYVVPTRVRLGLITLKKSDAADPAQAVALAKAVHERAAAGEDFARLAARYSRDPVADNDGDWGLVTRGAFRVKAVDDTLFALPVGQVGPLIETADAFYIVKALERETGRTAPFTEVQDALEEEIRGRKFNETVSKYIQDLYERSYVRVMMGNM